jgi:hypothetical protein
MMRVLKVIGHKIMVPTIEETQGLMGMQSAQIQLEDCVAYA